MMTGGQGSLELVGEPTGTAMGAAHEGPGRAAARKFRVVRPSAAESAAHLATLERVEQASGSACLWLKE